MEDPVLLKYDIIIYFSGNLSGFRIIPEFLKIFRFQAYFITERMVYFSKMMIIFFP